MKKAASKKEQANVVCKKVNKKWAMSDGCCSICIISLLKNIYLGFASIRNGCCSICIISLLKNIY